jgi:hypothetical protein
MMSPMLNALALALQAQEPPKPPPAAPKEDLPSLEKRIFEREARRGPLARKIREVLDEGKSALAAAASV